MRRRLGILDNCLPRPGLGKQFEAEVGARSKRANRLKKAPPGLSWPLRAYPGVLGLNAADFLYRAHSNIEEPTLRRLAEFSETAMKVRSPPKLRHYVAHLLYR
jgi:hypothetical protein